mgnify:FL=1
MALAVFLQKYWSDNQVSATVTFRPEEASDLKAVMDYFRYDLKSISFLPALENKAYAQMPYEAITKEQYEKMLSAIASPQWEVENEDVECEKFCNNQSCVV